MKRTWSTGALALGALLVFGTGLTAQDVSVGVKAGLGISNISTDQLELVDTDSRTGFVAGGFLDIGLGSRFSIHPEVLYAQKGFKAMDAGVEAEAELDYIDIPVLLRFTPASEDQRVQPAVFVGGFVAFEAGCSLSGEIDGISLDDVDCDDPEADFERETTDAGAVFGAGVDVWLSDGLYLTFDGRYNLGIVDLETDEAAESVTSRGWFFTGGVGIPLGSR